MRKIAFLALVLGLISLCACLRMDPLAPQYRKYEEPPPRAAKQPSEIQLAASRTQYVDTLEQTLPMKDIVWQLVIPGATLRRMTLAGDTIYTETDKGSVYALDRRTGKTLWKHDPDRRLDFPPGEVSGMAQEIDKQANVVKDLQDQLETEKNKKDKDRGKIITLAGKLDEAKTALAATNAKDVTYILVGDRLHCFDRIYGASRWSFELPFAPNASPIGSVEYFFVVSLRGNRIHSYVFDSMREFATYKAMGNICTTPLFDSPSLYFASEDGVVYAYDIGGRMNWTYQTGGAIRAPLLLGGDTLYACSRDYAVYALDRVTGRVLWKFEAGYPLSTRPELRSGVLYSCSDDKMLYALDAAKGKMLWKVPCIERFVVGTPRRVFALGTSQELLGIDPKTGEVKTRHPLGPFKFVISNSADSILYVATEDGHIFALAESETKF
jgi:outer membrane protein assembly factor BamB